MRVLSIGACAALFSLACSSPDTTAKPEASAAKSAVADASDHAPADAKPGSYEDWCGGHGVPESQCTRCNAKLIPAFKAANDWCTEHDLPESQCKKCNPDLKIERPPKPGG